MENMNLSTFISEKEIKDKIQSLGQKLTKHFDGSEDVLALCVLRGSFIFFADLIREIDLELECDFLGLSSYGDKTTSSGEVKLTMDISTSVKGRDVLIVEDIVDTGLTMDYLQKMVRQREPKSLTTVSFLHKPEAMKVKCDVDFVGFEIPNDFVVGYGLDFQGLYRNLPYLAQIQQFN